MKNLISEDYKKIRKGYIIFQRIKLEKITNKKASSRNSDQLKLFDVQKYAFDNMNLVELPFCLLSNTDRGLKRVSLTSDGSERLEAVSEHGLPTALARRAVLGLLWMTKEKNSFQSQEVTFELRELVEGYMYPGKYNKYRAGGKLLAAVENQLHRVSFTRLVSKRWFDKELGRQIPMNAAIIDSIATINEGGKNSARVLRVNWGKEVFKSVQDSYTKGLNVETWVKLQDHPLDEALYRYLDRHLFGQNRKIKFNSCQEFARFKLGMRGTVIEKGGRTASSYIAKKLEESIDRLRGVGFGIHLQIQRHQPDFSISFERIKGFDNKVTDKDLTGKLVFEFQKAFHGVTDYKKARFPQKDRDTAKSWIDSYGFERATWIIKRCKELHSQSKYKNTTIRDLFFLETAGYSTIAAGEYDQMKMKKTGQLKLQLIEVRQGRWAKYQKAVLKKSEESGVADDSIHDQALSNAKKNMPHAFRMDIKSAQRAIIQIELRKLKMSRMNALTQEEFESYDSDEALEFAILERHGFNPLT